ncbi:ankyrin repeat domain-containing protein [Methylobacterium ajmalii]|uniref:ankyrin repeat domain-containing protein n=1 Tax=Methylobacterium ajmalii TaxID=2738439 RepID=UPI00190D9146|nr:ankyrin repeat domain-containing protein [Methylobacterium ajmalii]MBK3396931.1 ankyrin repeat domain-containing protein [Methylobacterium ajmalii]MBK3410745.1 ankyrin repeat domain-containing protein [Methylobacterium ajmalii]MBK3426605.1 ankyrin repeat domain-containing protein [Methylobacterium ajmalii]MBZ6417196.1 ankyrin repeat domain-containing protein [Methylobacterium sp.]
MLINGADPNQIKEGLIKIRPLHEAILAVENGGPFEMISLLIKYGSQINSDQPDLECVTPLLIALSNDLPDIAQFLLDAGADPSVIDDEGNSALHWCVENNDLEFAKNLLAKGAEKIIDQCSAIEGRSALGMAVHRLNVDMVRLLLDAGADVGKMDYNFDTIRDCLPPIDSSNEIAWNEISQLIDNAI